ncbi:MAG TPA: (Fe-S)-binding protein, partial [Negativicutes bacterium]|nr:(Fe-S)-binding protein [Negativicutes bacterium]
CCGDSFYGTLPVEQVKAQMKKRAAEMPCEDVVVYCVSCIKALHIGGKQPRYLVDLLFGEKTDIGTWEPDAWHNEVQQFIDAH